MSSTALLIMDVQNGVVSRFTHNAPDLLPTLAALRKLVGCRCGQE